jgi:hypothetical protein
LREGQRVKHGDTERERKTDDLRKRGIDLGANKATWQGVDILRGIAVFQARIMVVTGLSVSDM